MRKPAFSLSRGLVRMSWNKYNLYNLSRLNTPRRTSKTLFQQKWAAKKETRGYHGDHLRERRFQLIFEPRLPTSGLRTQTINKDNEMGNSGGPTQVPLSMLAYASLERRIDIIVFRCHFARSARQARQMCLHGKIYLNGKKIKAANIMLKPGDMITVEPSAIPILKPPSKTKNESSIGDTSDTEISKELSSNLTETESGSSTTSSDSSDTKDDTPTPTHTINTSYVEAKKEEKQLDIPLDFNYVPYMQPFMFIPDYLEVSYKTCSAVYLRHPLPRQHRSEVPSPFPPESHSLAYEFYARRRKA